VVVGSAGCGCTSHLDVNTRRGAVRERQELPPNYRSPSPGNFIRSCAPNNLRAKGHHLDSRFWCVVCLSQRPFGPRANQKKRNVLLARQIMGWLVWTTVCRVCKSSGRSWREPPHNVRFADADSWAQRAPDRCWTALGNNGVAQCLCTNSVKARDSAVEGNRWLKSLGLWTLEAIVVLVHLVEARNQYFPAKSNKVAMQIQRLSANCILTAANGLWSA
jgi:hypothetical protein